MRCHEARNLIGPYLDSELDAKTSCEIVQHLESCAECTRFFEEEEKLDKRIFSALREGQKDPALWARLESSIAEHHRWEKLWPRLRLAQVGLATALAVVLIAISLSLGFRERVPDLALAVEQDHEEFLAGKFIPEFTGPLPEPVAHRLDARLDARAFSHLPVASGFEAKGSRLCFLRGVPAAWTLGHYANALVSVFVLKQSELEHFPQIKRRLQSGDPVVCIRAGRYQFAARLVGDHVVCVVASASKQTLEELVNSVPGSG